MSRDETKSATTIHQPFFVGWLASQRTMTIYLAILCHVYRSENEREREFMMTLHSYDECLERPKELVYMYNNKLLETALLVGASLKRTPIICLCSVMKRIDWLLHEVVSEFGPEPS